MIRFACPVCHAALNVPDAAVGKKGPCPKCGQRLQIPALPQNRTILGINFPNESKDGSAPLVLPKEAASDIQSVQSPTLAPAPGRRSWLRLTSPTFLIGALVLFFLPWVDIRCSTADSGKTLASQSGFQMIYGGYSLPAAWESQGMDGRQYVKEKFGVESCSFAPLLGLFFLLLIGAIVGAFSASARPFALALAIASLLILFGHLFFGLPAQRDLTFFYRELAKDKKDFNGFAILIETRLTIWFWLALLFLLSAVGSLVAETSNWIKIRRARFWILGMPKRNASRSVFPHSSAEARATPATEPISVTLVPAEPPQVRKRVRSTAKMLLLAAMGLLMVSLAGWATIAAMRGTDERGEQTAGDIFQISLTEDQRVAWRKARSTYKRLPVHIVACLSPDKETRLLFGKKAEEDFWRFAYARGTLVLDRFGEAQFPLWAKGSRLGSGYYGATVKFEESDEFAEMQQLTKAARQRREDWLRDAETKWEKGEAGKESFRKYKEKVIAEGDNDSPKEQYKKSFEARAFSAALELCESLALRAEVRAVAIVDLFAGENISVLRWYWSDGEKVQSSERAPNPQRRKSLHRFLEDLARHGAEL